MENENGDGHPELDSEPAGGRQKNSPMELVAFLVIYGWPGPMAIWIGLRDSEIAVIIVGIFITVFLWGFFGITILKDFLKIRG
jgi:hypothetical protein